MIATCFALTSFSQTASINTSRSNIKQGIAASYSTSGGLYLTLSDSGTDVADKKAIASGFFVVDRDLILTDTECKAINAPKGTRIKKGKWVIKKQGDAYFIDLVYVIRNVQ